MQYIIGSTFKHTHKLENLGQFLQRNSLVWGLDQTTRKEVNSLNTILAVANVAALDIDHLDNGGEDGSLEESIGRHTDSNYRATGTGILDSLLERFFGDSKQEHSMGTKAPRGSSLDVFDKVLGLGEINVGLDIH
jgi:hypothetical protein